VGGVNDTAGEQIFSNIFADKFMEILFKNLVADEQCWAVSMTPLINGGVGGVNDTCDH
jgi:hypothetical protein